MFRGLSVLITGEKVAERAVVMSSAMRLLEMGMVMFITSRR